MHVARPRRGVAGAPVREVELGIVVASEPDGHAAGLPGVAGPGVVSWLARAGDGVGPPHLLPGARVERRDVPADAQLPAGCPDHDLALGDERGEREVVALLVVIDRLVPHDLAGLRVEGDHVGVDGADVHLVLVEPDAAVGRVELQEILGELLLVAPEDVPGLGVEGDHLLLGRGDEHDAVVHDGWRLMSLGHPRGEAPYRHELRHVGGRDPIEGTVAPARVVAAIHQPVLRLRVEEAAVRDIGIAHRRLGAQPGRGGQHHR